MKTYTLILILFLIASVCSAHDAWVSGSTDRQHLSGADLKNYLHGHKEINQRRAVRTVLLGL